MRTEIKPIIVFRCIVPHKATSFTEQMVVVNIYKQAAF